MTWGENSHKLRSPFYHSASVSSSAKWESSSAWHPGWLWQLTEIMYSRPLCQCLACNGSCSHFIMRSLLGPCSLCMSQHTACKVPVCLLCTCL